MNILSTRADYTPNRRRQVAAEFMDESYPHSLSVYCNALIAANLSSESMNESDSHAQLYDSVDLQTGAYSNSTVVVFDRGGKGFTLSDWSDSEPAALVDLISNCIEYEPVWTWASKAVSGWSLIPVRYSFSLDEAQRQLKEISAEVEETCSVANDVNTIPDTAYSDTLSLLARLQHTIPMPDMMWLQDGGIGLEWRPDNGIATMSIFGDNHVIYGAFFNDKREVEGICSLSDNSLLDGFLTTLSRLFQ